MNILKRKIENIFLDVGNVIYYDYPTTIAFIDNVTYLLQKAGIKIIPKELEALIIEKRKGTEHAIENFVKEKYPQQSQPICDQAWSLVRENWMDYIQQVPDSVEVIKKLTKQFKLGIIANQPPECLVALKELKILQLFSTITIDSLETLRKPGPDIFYKALSNTQCSAEESVYIGDKVHQDIIPSSSLGFTAILFRPEKPAKYLMSLNRKWQKLCDLSFENIEDEQDLPREVYKTSNLVQLEEILYGLQR